MLQVLYDWNCFFFMTMNVMWKNRVVTEVYLLHKYEPTSVAFIRNINLSATHSTLGTSTLPHHELARLHFSCWAFTRKNKLKKLLVWVSYWIAYWLYCKMCRTAVRSERLHLSGFKGNAKLLYMWSVVLSHTPTKTHLTNVWACLWRLNPRCKI